MEILTNFFTDNFWAAISLIAMITVPLTSFINQKFNVNKVWKQIVSWGIGFILTAVFYFTGVIILNEPWWLAILLTGIVSGLTSNGIYDVPTVKEKISKWVGILVKFTTKNKDLPEKTEEKEK